MYIRNNPKFWMAQLALILSLFAGSLFAQTATGTIDGLVKDSGGGLVPNAKVKILNVETGVAVNLVTGSSGRYVAPLLLPGQYSVTVSADGFRGESKTNIVLSVAQERVVDFDLAVGDAGASVEVTVQSAAAIDMGSSSTAQVITAKQIDTLPLSGRNPLDLALLAAGVQGTGDTTQTTPHISGSRNANSEQLIDGISNSVSTNNIGLSYVAYPPIVDSVQEFSVQTSVPPAEYGRTGGGVINLVTKYGTNKIHGSGFYFVHDAYFDARPYFLAPTSPKTDQRLTQLGGTVGGHLIKDKAFYFFAFERSSNRSSTQEIDSVPLAAWRSGDFSSLSVPIYDPTSAVSVGGKVTRTSTFSSNQIPTARQNTVALAALKYYPLPNYGATGATLNNFLAVGITQDLYYHADARFDYTFGPKNRIYGRFSKYDDVNTPFNGYGNIAARTGSGPAHTTATSGVMNDTWTISPNVLAEFRYGLTRYTVDRTAFGQGFNLTDLGLPATYQTQAATKATVFPSFDLSDSFSGLGMNGGYVPYSSYNTTHDASASVTFLKGHHTIKVGSNFRKFFVNYYQYGYPSGDFSFNRTWTQYNPNDQTDTSGGAGIANAGNAFASMLLGLPASGYMTHDATALTSSSYIAGYIQDDWRATSKLTINAGLRWEGEIPRTDRHNQLTYWDPNVASPLGSVSSTNCPACASLKGAMVFVGTSGAKYGRRQAPFQAKNFSPRIGFSYSPTPKWAIRGGFAVLFAPSALQAAGSTGGLGADGFNTTTNFQFTADSQATIYTTLSDPAKAGYNLPTGAANGAGTNLGTSINYSYFDSYRNPYTEQANLTIQRELPLQTILEVGYVYSHGLFLVDGDPGQPYNQVNPSYLSLGNALNANVTNPFYGKITTAGSPMANATIPYKYLLDAFPQYTAVTSQRKPRAASIYNSFFVRVDKRLSHNLSLLVSFTGAKLMDNSSSAVTFLGPTSGTRADQFRPDKEWSLSAYDLAQNLTIASTYQLPFGRGQRFLATAPHAVSLLVGGWQASAYITTNGGLPVVLSAANNVTGLLSLSQRPNMAVGDANIANRSRAKWFNTSLFSQPAAFTIGNAPRVLGNVRQPGNRNADLSVLKNNYFGAENRYNVQLRLEAFNALNHPVLGGPNTNVNSTAFGTITSIGGRGARVVQFGGKFVF